MRSALRSVPTRGSRSAAALGLAAVLGLTGCMGIPTAGPVRSGRVLEDEPGFALPVPEDPTVDATPEQLVYGFLSAGEAGLSDEFSAARKFLAAETAEEWDPRAGVLVYLSLPEVQLHEDGTVTAVVQVAASVDGSGRYTEAVPGARAEELVFQLIQDDLGQWRILAPSDGVLMSEASFERLYREIPVYFATRDSEVLVPDLRHLPITKLATSAVSALLEGPAPWLRDAVISGVPENTRLSAAAVTLSDEYVALVDLAPRAGLNDNTDRELLQAQLEATLGGLPGTLVNGVQVSVGGIPWDSTGVLEMSRDVRPGAGPYVLAGDQLALIESREVVPQDTAPLTGLDAHDPAVSLDGVVRVVLDGSGRLLQLPAGGAAPVPLLTVTDPVAPSIDRFDWVWTAQRAATGSVYAAGPGREAVSMRVEWLDGRSVRSLRVARDGSRIAFVSVGADGRVSVDVASLVRDGDGRPLRIGEEPLQVGQLLTDATQVAWVDDVTLAVLGRSGSSAGPTMHLVPVGGPIEALSHTEGTVGIAAGRGDLALYLLDDDGALLLRQSNSWVEIASGVRDPVFPG